MILEWLLRQLVGFVTWAAGQMAALMPPVPAWLLDLVHHIGVMVGYIAQAGAWFPVELLAPALLVIVASTVAGLAIKVVRIVASFLTLGGGGAG